MTLNPSALQYFRSEVPRGTRGEWAIEKIAIAERPYDPGTDTRPDCFKFRPGTYTLLRRGPTQFMTDLYDEWWTQRIAILESVSRGGSILITGLGLGLIAEAILRESENRVRRITIVEQAEEVIALVAPYLHGRWPGRIEIVQGDAFSWIAPVGVRYSVAWHDIWPDPMASSVDDEVTRLREHHAAWCDWQGFWPETYRQALAPATAACSGDVSLAIGGSLQ